MKEETTKAGTAIVAKAKVFEPKQIGEADYRRDQSILSNYEKIVVTLNDLKANLETCLEREHPYELLEFMDFLRSDSTKWIVYKHIEYNNISYPGLDNDKMIELGIVKVDGIEKVFEIEEKLSKTLETISNDSFYFPINKLWDTEAYEFNLTMPFVEEAANHCSRFTRSQEQNEIVDIMQKICDELNKLANLNILRPQHGPAELSNLANWIETVGARQYQNNKGEYIEPYTIKPLLFWSHRMSAWKIPGIDHTEFRSRETLFNDINIKQK